VHMHWLGRCTLQRNQKGVNTSFLKQCPTNECTESIPIAAEQHIQSPSNTQHLKSTPRSPNRRTTTPNTISYSNTIERPSMQIIRKRDTTTGLTMSKHITCCKFESVSSQSTRSDYLHPTVPVLGVADSVAVTTPPKRRLAEGIVHVPSEIVKVVAVPALPSVGGSL
jgi:hypothetical protein